MSASSSDSEHDYRVAKRQKVHDYYRQKLENRRKVIKDCNELLDSKIDDERIRTDRGDIVIRLAVERGNKDNLLRQLKRQVSKVDSGGMTCLQLAIYLGHHELIGLLIQHGYTTRDVTMSLCESPKSIECLNELLRYKKDILLNESDVMKRSILFVTAVERPDKIDFIEKLIEIGCDLNAKDSSKRGILHRLAFKDFTTKPYLKVAELLVKRGIDIELKDEFQETALESAVVYRNFDLMRLLLRNGASMDSRVLPTLAHRAYDSLKFSCLRTIMKFCLVRSMQGKTVDEKVMAFIKLPKCSTYYNLSLEQINVLKIQKIMNTNWNMYDFIIKPPRITARYIRNENFLVAIEKFKKWSEFSYDIEIARKDAVIRRNLEDLCTETLKNVFQLPELCLYNINSFLDNDDLRNIHIAWGY